MATLSLTDIVFNSDIESSTVNSIFSEIESFLNGTTGSADINLTGTMTADEFQTGADGSGIGSGSYVMGAGDDAAIYWDSSDIVLEASTSLTNSIQYLDLKHITSGTPAAGIGSGIKSIVETSASNNEIGSLIETVSTDVTPGSEDFDFVLKLMTGGSAASEKFRITSNGLLTTSSINLSSSTEVSSILDEDNMASDSDTALATQQSIKAYVDSQVGIPDDWQEVMTAGNTYYVTTNDGNPEARIGASDSEEVHFQAIYDTGAQTLDYALFQTDTASATADKGLFRFNVDGTDILDIDDGGINFSSGNGISINGTDIITDSGSQATLSNIFFIDTNTRDTIKASLVPVLTSLPNLTSTGTLTSLSVSGDFTVDTDSLYVDSTNDRIGIGTSSPSTDLTIRNTGTGTTHSSNASIRMESTASGRTSTIQFSDGVIASYISSNSGNISIGGSTETMTAFLGGGVNIGSPTGGNKGIGTLNTSGDIYKNNSAYTNPDYVFEKYFTGEIKKFIGNDGAKEYVGLTEIDSLESALKGTFRLPGMDGEAKGIFSRSDFILEKIEEAYLYIIELNSRIKKLEGK